ncbi:hypothetical protein M066_0716 [Bacteroides fragilis str. I1345]|uniref:Uncharacterized protein n=1 Tax=Bacteroides fragilis str. 3783N1-6 TaxID=1339310 RepID=A0AB73APV4_BACFG|nr:hypothetical protein M080_0708 [Bacteroides fragilis str. 3397 T10]EXY47726.1 hypothetical protein M118_0680 [Bacteroides fragilis str. 3783N1-2]EXY52498.1 hypothetical protein M121_0670 [Bacteroides fragilis str. 3783N2-1]EXY57237.1 hypothetical protein M122_0672 [Bacteroides fragilis str. 3976T7]EXZ01845.1 hypothetical protein M074_0753 [Bacteroides fragilis str. DS-166]EXZ69323.1 hypothetical protein M120_0969 [Bacteroides fragilis str. 3783N1-8]EXZ79988.1 hypothetical protein M144_0708
MLPQTGYLTGIYVLSNSTGYRILKKMLNIQCSCTDSFRLLLSISSFFLSLRQIKQRPENQ